jgi:hypothetical protein
MLTSFVYLYTKNNFLEAALYSPIKLPLQNFSANAVKLREKHLPRELVKYWQQLVQSVVHSCWFMVHGLQQ